MGTHRWPHMVAPRRAAPLAPGGGGRPLRFRLVCEMEVGSKRSGAGSGRGGGWRGRVAGLLSAVPVPRVRCTRGELVGALAPEGGKDHCPCSTSMRMAMRAPTVTRLPGHVVRPLGWTTTSAWVRGGLFLMAETQDW